MKLLTSFLKKLLVIAVLLKTINVFAQKKSAPTATWIMPGISWQLKTKISLFTQFGVNDFQQMKFIFTQGAVTLNKHVSVSAGFFFLQSTGISRFTEHDIIIAGVFSKSFKKLVLEDRNMFRGVMIRNSPNDLIYRNRIRALYPFCLLSRKGTFYLLDEGYYSLGKGLWTRNRAGLGMSYNIFCKTTLDVSYLQQDDKFSGKTNLIFLQLILNLPLKKA